MERIFYKKWTAAIFVAAILVVVLLLCLLLVNLVQFQAAKDRIARFEELLKQAGETIEERQELLEYLQSDDYVREWAEKHDRINQDDITWLEKNS